MLLTVIGLAVLFGCIVGGYALHGGVLDILFQPSEVLIICGAALGSVLIGTPSKILRLVGRGVRRTLIGTGFTTQHYTELFHLLYETFSLMRKNGDMAIEQDIETPAASPLFSTYPTFLTNAIARDLLCDSLRLVVSGTADPQEVEQLMTEDIATHEEDWHRPASLLSKIGDTLPALGIIAAVLGVINAMQFLDAGPSVLGKRIAAALVGTFLGVLFSYGIVQPIATKMEILAQEERRYLECIKIALMAYLHGAAPIVAVEYARRALFHDERPSASQLESTVKRRAQTVLG